MVTIKAIPSQFSGESFIKPRVFPEARGDKHGKRKAIQMSVLRINQKHFKGNTVEQIGRSPYPAVQIMPATVEPESEQE
ncbi:hypothetical protein P4B35_02315 [Pontiellaceae bacterium B12227]|nr:hypothetical protein [Pontiellaceae bacterium B12227]